MANGESIRVAVLGAGSVGCYFGGMLARAGHDVTMIGRPVHVDAFKARGLRFEGLRFDEVVPVKASTEASAVRGCGMVLFCVKSTDTDSAAAQIAPHLDHDDYARQLSHCHHDSRRLDEHNAPCAVTTTGRKCKL